MRDKSLDSVANALAQSVDHIYNFFKAIRTELAFYIGCINLNKILSEKQKVFCFPTVVPFGNKKLSFSGLYDICLALSSEQKIISNDLEAEGKDIIIITGANSGGKSTYLRSLGIAQLMAQCGMFVPAENYTAELKDGIVSHFKREEDSNMISGKLDEELSRMNQIIDKINSKFLILFNESFAATNEKEGAEIARQITKALIDKGIKVIFVTHNYEYANIFYNMKLPNVLFLRAERKNDGTRTFKIIEAEPLQTSFGKDLYNKIFEVT